jgi:hypothetical protein
MPTLRCHLGTVSVDQVGPDRSRLIWNVDFVFRTVHPFRLLLPSFLRQFEGVLKAGVENLRGQLESGIEHAHTNAHAGHTRARRPTERWGRGRDA